MAITCEYSKLSVDGERQISEQVFRSHTFAAVSDEDIMEQLAMTMQEIFQHSQEFQAEGSGRSLERVLLLTVHCSLPTTNGKQLHQATGIHCKEECGTQSPE